jgi:hypothetical protein
MKTLFSKLFAVGFLSAALLSCEKEGEKVYLKTGGNMTLTSDKTTLVLLDANATQPGVSFAWNKAEFGYQAGTTYTLQMSKTGTNWAPTTSLSIDMGNSLSKTFTVGQLNQELIKFLPAFVANDVDFRIIASVGTAATPIYSNVVKVKITPYRQLIQYAFPKALNVAGNYQGWSPGSAPQIVDKFGTATGGNYEGYINFNNPSPEFKLVRGNDWPFGDHGMASPGVLTANGGSNITLPSAGIYLLRADRTNLTYSATKINSWAVIGSATPGGWGVETPMTFDPATKLYAITLNLSAGEIKFRANNDWPINFGDNGNDGSLDYGGANMPIAVAGNYTITLDLLIGGNYAYTIKKN